MFCINENFILHRQIGIIGRAESCSYLITSLLRLAKQNDIIYIDGVDISKLGVHELRSKISVIPRNPVLFCQTLRWNLDPLNEFSDEQLWNALEQVCCCQSRIAEILDNYCSHILTRQNVYNAEF